MRIQSESYYEVNHLAPYCTTIKEVKIEDAIGAVYTGDEAKELIADLDQVHGKDSFERERGVEYYIDAVGVVIEVEKHLAKSVKNKRWPIPVDIPLSGHDAYTQAKLRDAGYIISLGFVKPLVVKVRKAKLTDNQIALFGSRLLSELNYLIYHDYKISLGDYNHVRDDEHFNKFVKLCKKLGYTFDDLIDDSKEFMNCFTAHEDTHQELFDLIKPQYQARFDAVIA